MEDFERAVTSTDPVLERMGAPDVAPSIAGVVFALRQVNECEAVMLNLPADVWAMVEPQHTAIRLATTRSARRSAWRAWRKRVEHVAHSLETTT